MNWKLPIVDFNSQTAAKDFCQSLHETGFGVLKNHPLKRSVVQDIYDEWLNFFTASDAKNKYPQDPVKRDGYFSPAISETAKDHDKRDLKEFYHIYPWGRYPIEVSDNAQEYFKDVKELANTLLNWVEEYTPAEIKQKYSMPLPKMIEGSDQTLLRVLHYPPLTGSEDKDALRAAAHTDINLLTILPAANEPGLQIYGQDQQWHDVPCDFGLLIVNIGDMLSEASRQYYPSTIHRVLNPVGAAAKKPRISLPLFLHPNRDVVLSEQYTVESYFNERMNELWGRTTTK